MSVASEGTTGAGQPDRHDRAAVQRRTVRVLFVSVLPAGAALTASMSATALLGKDITGSGALGTLAAAFLTLGTAGATVPVARHMARHGRRAGLRRAWWVAAAGATCSLAAAVTDLYPLLLVGATAAGVGNAATLAARYAASDLAEEAERARAIGILVWAGSFGSVLGPTVGLGWTGAAMDRIGLPELAGPYAMGAVLFAVAAWWIDRQLHPDPLEVAGGIEPREPGRVERSAAAAAGAHVRAIGDTLRLILAHRAARLAVAAMVVGHAVMVSVMTATPLHMDDGNHELRIIGLVISVHVVGMYFFAPLVGAVVDRLGSSMVIAAGGAVLFAGAELASHTDAHDSLGVFVGLFLIGVGWSFGLVAGSSLLTASFAPARRVAVQGTADLVMGTAGAVAALSAGVVYEFASYHALSHYAGLASIGLIALAGWSIIRRPTEALRAGR